MYDEHSLASFRSATVCVSVAALIKLNYNLFCLHIHTAVSVNIIMASCVGLVINHRALSGL